MTGINLNKRTDLWSIKKQKWFGGPTIPDRSISFESGIAIFNEALNVQYVCLVAVNNSAIYIMGRDGSEHYLISFNFWSKTWHNHRPNPIYNTYTEDCVHYITKQLKK